VVSGRHRQRFNKFGGIIVGFRFSHMMNRHSIVATLCALFCATAFAADAPSLDATRQKLETIAGRVTYFATQEIIRNRWIEPRWPANLMLEQQQLLADLRGLGGERAALATLLGHPDPKVCTLALGALFVREDPHDLPLIAALVGRSDATFPLLRMSLDSRSGPLPLAQFVSPQTVGDVAGAMLEFYLKAAGVIEHRPADMSEAFASYWSDRGTRDRCASWFLVKMQRVTRQTSPLQREYQKDIQRVLGEIQSLPLPERAWTQFYVAQGVFLSDSNELISDASLVAALKGVGPDALMKFLRNEQPMDDPDLNNRFLYLDAFILRHAPALLRPGDADAVLACADGELPKRRVGRLLWVAAAAELRGIEDPVKAADFLKREIADIPLKGYEGQNEQAGLAAALWRMRGAAEKDWLANWFYTVLPLARDNMAHGPESFLRAVEKEARPDTRGLLASIVGDVRFPTADWSSLAQILELVNATLDTPLVEKGEIYDYQPNSKRPDQQETLAGWRDLLRRNLERP
jgi:hypothetical protein